MTKNKVWAWCPLLESFHRKQQITLNERSVNLQGSKKVGFCKWQSTGADVNQKLFRGFATTAAVREGRLEILEILLKAGASQPACEEALLEASCHGQARLVELLMCSDLIRPHVAVHALVTACCRGFADIVDTLIKVIPLAAKTSYIFQQIMIPLLVWVLVKHLNELSSSSFTVWLLAC